MEILCVVYYMIAIIYIFYSFYSYYITPNLIFATIQIVMFIGITGYADYTMNADRQLVFIYMLALIFFIISSAFNFKRYNLKNRKVEVSENEELSQIQRIVIWIMVTVAVLACSYLFARSGGNVFIQSLKSFLGNSDYSIKVGRKNILDVAGVGYIYQFRTIILPILTVYLINAGGIKEKNIAYAIFPLMIIFILGTGQRGGFVMFVLIWATALLLVHRYYGESNLRKLIILGVGFILLFSITTILNGRVSNDGTVVGAMMARIMDDNQACAIRGFRYIIDQPVQWGVDWFSQIIDILPGKNEYQSLATKIFARMNGGSTAGTAPACLWGSAFYNWGWLGVTLFPWILGHFYSYVYMCFVKKPSNKLRIFLYSGEFVILGMWVSDGPMVLFNQGFITVVLMIWVISFSRRFVFGAIK